MSVTLWHGDCLERMRDIPDGSVDMVLCDLPYGVTARNKWDVVIPFEPLWEQYHRVCKPNAAIVLHCQQPFTTDLIASNRKEFKYLWYWDKHQVSGFLNAKKQPLRRIEEIAVFYSKQCEYQPQMRAGKRQIKATGRGSSNYGGYTYQPHVSDKYYPTSLLSFAPATIQARAPHPEASLPAGVFDSDVHAGGRNGAGQLHGFRLHGCSLYQHGAEVHWDREGRRMVPHSREADYGVPEKLCRRVRVGTTA